MCVLYYIYAYKCNITFRIFEIYIYTLLSPLKIGDFGHLKILFPNFIRQLEQDQSKMLRQRKDAHLTGDCG